MLVTCVHIPTTKRFNEGIKIFDEVLAVDDSLGKYDYPFEILSDYQDFPLYDYIQGSAASKNYGFYKAYHSDVEYVFFLDSDCIPEKDFKEKHIEAMEKGGQGWINPLQSDKWFSRGFPYSQRNKRVACNMGLWINVLDINGADRAEDEPTHPNVEGTHSAPAPMPFSGMNFCIRREALPALFFVPNFGNFRRHDDIFGGYILHKFIQKAGDVMTYGEPYVYHETTVVPEEDAEAESEMNQHDDEFYAIVDKIFEKIEPDTYHNMLQAFDESLFEGTRFEEAIKPFQLWKYIMS